jgi:hypothetical protein
MQQAYAAQREIRMKPQVASPAQEVLAGLVERVTFHNGENGFCVLRAKARGQRDLVTVVGHAATIAAGEWITASGEWVNDRTHGQQFKARFLRTSAPTSVDGIEKYLSSGMIRGIGPVLRQKAGTGFRRDRGRARPPAGGGWDRTGAGEPYRHRLGRAEGCDDRACIPSHNSYDAFEDRSRANFNKPHKCRA